MSGGEGKGQMDKDRGDRRERGSRRAGAWWEKSVENRGGFRGQVGENKRFEG